MSKPDLPLLVLRTTFRIRHFQAYLSQELDRARRLIVLNADILEERFVLASSGEQPQAILPAGLQNSPRFLANTYQGTLTCFVAYPSS